MSEIFAEECTGERLLGRQSCAAEVDPSVETIALRGRLACSACIESLIYKDELTQAGNLRELKETVNELIQSEAPFGLIQLDIENFKFVNDTYGHGEGDEMIKNVTKFLSHSIRGPEKSKEEDNSDVDHLFSATRRGGDEFVVVARLASRETKQPVDTPVEALSKMAFRLKSTFTQYEPIVEYNDRIEVLASDKTLGIKIGMSVWEQGKSLNELLDESDPKVNNTTQSDFTL